MRYIASQEATGKESQCKHLSPHLEAQQWLPQQASFLLFYPRAVQATHTRAASTSQLAHHVGQQPACNLQQEGTPYREQRQQNGPSYLNLTVFRGQHCEKTGSISLLACQDHGFCCSIARSHWSVRKISALTKSVPARAHGTRKWQMRFSDPTDLSP